MSATKTRGIQGRLVHTLPTISCICFPYPFPAVWKSAARSPAGGTHHAHRDFGAGFNPFNDLALAALTLLEKKLVSNVWEIASRPKKRGLHLGSKPGIWESKAGFGEWRSKFGFGPPIQGLESSPDRAFL
jgi:hypothetical protein